MKTSFSLLLFLGCLQAVFAAAPQVISLSGDKLMRAKEALRAGDARFRPAYEQFLRDARKILAATPRSVMDKKLVPPSGDKHDYLSFGPYWWPDPKKPNGLPYLRKDGQVNPESKNGTDSNPFGYTCGAVEMLGLAYYFTGDREFADKAVLFTRVWFLNAETRMSPHANFGQGVPGRTQGRAEGVLELRHLCALTDGLSLLKGSGAWTEADEKALRSWLEDYYRWLTTSKIGIAERDAKNNHGTWYDAQAIHLALYLGKRDEAEKMAKAALTQRIASQIEPDGSQPHELARTNSLGYSLFNLQAFIHVARLAEHVGVDLWGADAKDGRSVLNALRYLAPYADAKKAWPKKDIKAPDRNALFELIAQVPVKYTEKEFRPLIAQHAPASTQTERWRLLWD